MAVIVSGEVSGNLKFGYGNTEKKTPYLKFNVMVKGNRYKLVPVIVFGKTAEKNFTLCDGQDVVVTGDMSESTWNGEVTEELKVLDWRGGIRLVGEKRVRDNSDTIDAIRDYRDFSGEPPWGEGEEPRDEDCSACMCACHGDYEHYNDDTE